MKGYGKYVILAGLLFAVLVLVEYYRPKPINWDQTFANKDKIPYGTYLLYELLPDIFPEEPIQAVRLPIVNQLEDNTQQAGNYVFVNKSFDADSLDVEALLAYVSRGSQVFISAHYFPKQLEDTLHFTTDFTASKPADSVALTFTNPAIKPGKLIKYDWDKVNAFIQPGSGRTIHVLGKVKNGAVNFVQIPFGRGNFYLHSAPLALCNYHVISDGGATYAAAALSHLPVRPVWWDEYQKQGRLDNGSVFRVLVSHEPLRWAYYLTLGGLLLFILFESKRTQRIIPVMEKPRNTTVEFVRVVGNLYFNYKSHKLIAEKKINYFLEYLRLHYHESAMEPDKEFRERVAAKSGVALTHINELFAFVDEIQNAGSIPERYLIQFNTKLEQFYQQASRWHS